MNTHPIDNAASSSWMQRNWKWAVPVIGLLVLVVFGGLIGAVLFGVRSMMQSSEPYQVAMDEARRHPVVSAALGEPIEAGFLPMGNISTSGDSGEAKLSISLHGPRGQGQVHVEARRKGGRWHYRHLVAELADRPERVDLLPVGE